MIITAKILQRYGIAGMAVWPFILVAKPGYKERKCLINHECIHLRQQVETLLIGFIFLYFGQYLWFRLQGMDHYQSYKMLMMEKEAKKNENNLSYLKTRKPYSFINHVKNH